MLNSILLKKYYFYYICRIIVNQDFSISYKNKMKETTI